METEIKRKKLYFEIPLPKKQSAKIVLPNDIDEDDLEAINTIIKIYLKYQNKLISLE